MSPKERAALIRRHARQLGFDAVGVTDLSPPPHGGELRSWLERGMAGDMHYMQRQLGRRLRPERIVPGASRAIVLSRDYFNSDPPRPAGAGKVAKYARGADYHLTLARPLAELASFVRSLGDEKTTAKWYVDAGPVPERELAQRSGIGWIGKNTMLIDPQRGSFSFLCAVLTDLDLELDEPFEADRCGSCRRCLDACPASAFPEERVLDARRCISYLTIEHKGALPAEQRRLTGEWVFGCDVCQQVCPWNRKFARESGAGDLGLESSRAHVDLNWLAGITDEEFAASLGWTPLQRPGAAGMRRNARMAMENLKEETPCPTS